MLEALGPEDAAYYSEREHVVRGGSRSEQLYNDLVDRFVFVAGAQSEYEKYFNRPLPKGMWGWALESEVQALSGFAAVAKKPKNGIVRQRKLLMCVPGNYLMEDGKSAVELGLHGGAALGRTMIDRSEGGLAVASLDQSNAFSSVKVPEWMSYFQCCPALRASVVWHLLPESYRKVLTPQSWVYPRYRRLAMGSSHSVKILMGINMHCVGRLLFGRRQLAMPPSRAYDSPRQWLKEIQHVRRGDVRVIVILHQYSGATRKGALSALASRAMRTATVYVPSASPSRETRPAGPVVVMEKSSVCRPSPSRRNTDAPGTGWPAPSRTVITARHAGVSRISTPSTRASSLISIGPTVTLAGAEGALPKSIAPPALAWYRPARSPLTSNRPSASVWSSA